MGFDELLNAYLPIKYQSPEQRKVCPNCAFALEETERGLFCKFCGWTPGIPPPYIPKIPDSNVQ